MFDRQGSAARGEPSLPRPRPGRTFMSPGDVAEALGVDTETAAKKLSRWAEDGWVRRVRRGLYIGVPVDASNPATWSEDALRVASAVWSPCYFTGSTAAHHWALTNRSSGRLCSRRRNGYAVLRSNNHHDYVVMHVENAARVGAQ